MQNHLRAAVKAARDRQHPKRGRNIPPTLERAMHGPDHRPPASGMMTADGTLWKGASRVVNPAAKRKANRASWRKLRADWRRDGMAAARLRRAG